MRLLTALFVSFALVCLPQPSKADVIPLFSSLQTSGTFACGPGGSASVPCDLQGFYKVSFQCTSTSGSVATVQIQVRNDPSQAWATVVTQINPGPNDQGYIGPGLGQLQVVVTWTSGILTGTLTRTK